MKSKYWHMLSLASLVHQPWYNIQCELFTEHDRYKSVMVNDDDGDGDVDADIDDDRHIYVCKMSVTFQYDSEIWFFLFHCFFVFIIFYPLSFWYWDQILTTKC